MQTRKRAKSVTFGKKSKEKEEAKKTAEEETIKVDKAEKETKEEASEKSTEKTSGLSGELSATLPKTEAEPEPESEPASSAVETPASEFISENPLSANPESPKETKEEPAADAAQPATTSSVTGAELSAPIETPPSQPITTPVEPQSAQESSAPQPSAFTIQSNEQNPEQPVAQMSETGTRKKSFGIYFFVVALIAFILGLGAMAAASYFGFINSKLPSSVNIPLIGQKPTATVPPPAATVTPKSVDLTAFTISVLNGSGISGKAADEKTALTAAGFKVTSTGNADNSNFTKTEIAAKKAVSQEFLNKLETELGKSFTVDSNVAPSLDSSSTDVTVTLGSDTAK